MSNQINVKVHCKNTDQWYDIDSSTDIDELIATIQEEAEGKMVEDITPEFDEWVLPELLKGFEGEEIPADLPEAIEALEDADHDLEVYEAYEDNMGTSPSSASDIQNLIRDADEAYQGEYRDDETFAREIAEELGDIEEDQWPYTCIDWEWAAKEIMMDYFESNGHYFRNI